MSDYYPKPSIIFPSQLISGDLWALNLDSGAYSAGYSASITFASGSIKITSAAVFTNNQFIWAVPGTQTSTLMPGTVAYAVSVSDGSNNRLTIESGSVSVIADISAIGAVQTQSILQQQLAAIDATFLALVSQETSMVTFAGKTYTLWNLVELQKVRNDIAARVADEADRLRGNNRARRIVPYFVSR